MIVDSAIIKAFDIGYVFISGIYSQSHVVTIGQICVDL